EVAQERQSVRQETASDHENPLVTQWPQSSADRKQLLRVEARHRNLQDRNVSFRIHHSERNVSSVVEAALRLLRHFLIRQKLADIGSQLRRAGRPVLDAIVALGKTSEVVDEWNTGLGGAHRERRILPVCRHHQHGLWARQRFRPGGKLGHPERIVYERRRTGTYIERRHPARRVRFLCTFRNRARLFFRRDSPGCGFWLQLLVHQVYLLRRFLSRLCTSIRVSPRCRLPGRGRVGGNREPHKSNDPIPTAIKTTTRIEPRSEEGR